MINSNAFSAAGGFCQGSKTRKADGARYVFACIYSGFMKCETVSHFNGNGTTQRRKGAKVIFNTRKRGISRPIPKRGIHSTWGDQSQLADEFRALQPPGGGALAL
jgi:hypothetical protein